MKILVDGTNGHSRSLPDRPLKRLITRRSQVQILPPPLCDVARHRGQTGPASGSGSVRFAGPLRQRCGAESANTKTRASSSSAVMSSPTRCSTTTCAPWCAVVAAREDERGPRPIGGIDSEQVARHRRAVERDLEELRRTLHERCATSECVVLRDVALDQTVRGGRRHQHDAGRAEVARCAQVRRSSRD